MAQNHFCSFSHVGSLDSRIFTSVSYNKHFLNPAGQEMVSWTNIEGTWYTTTKQRSFHEIKCPKKEIITSTILVIYIYISISNMQIGCNYKKERSLNTSNSAFYPNIYLVFETIVNWLFCNSILLDNIFLCQHTTNLFGMSMLSFKFAVSKIQIYIFNKSLCFWVQLFLTKQCLLKFSSVATQFNTKGFST